MYSLENQFKQYLENNFTNPCIEESERLPFSKYDSIEEASIYLKVTSNNKDYYFEYDCYAITNDETCLYQFELVTEKSQLLM